MDRLHDLLEELRECRNTLEHLAVGRNGKPIVDRWKLLDDVAAKTKKFCELLFGVASPTARRTITIFLLQQIFHVNLKLSAVF